VKKRLAIFIGLTVCLFGLWNPGTALAQEELPFYLKDRGPGIPTSMFGTYILKGELLIYPFFEYYLDQNMEYKPNELGFGLDQDFRGKYRASEGLLFLGYGLTDRVALEIEAAVIHASLTKSPDDPSPMPPKLTESGLGDMQVQIDWMLSRESDHRPAWFSYAELVFPHHKNKVLIGTPDWETKAGTGVTRGFRWGTMTVRAALTYVAGRIDIGEWAVEYFKRLSPRVRLYAGVEGDQDEIALITEVQLYLSSNVRFIINNGFGITSKATDWAPEIGLMISFLKR